MDESKYKKIWGLMQKEKHINPRKIKWRKWQEENNQIKKNNEEIFPKLKGIHFQTERTNQFSIIKFSHQRNYHGISKEKGINTKSWLMDVGQNITEKYQG